MKDREEIITALGIRLDKAARASITRGAQYEPGEYITPDSVRAWTQVAETVVNLIELVVKEGREVEKKDD